MKYILVTLMLTFLAIGGMLAQSGATVPGTFIYDMAAPVSLIHLGSIATNYTSSSDDSTAYLSFDGLGTSLGACREIYLIGQSTDSVAVDVTLRLRNSTLTSLTTTYADSMVSTSNTGAFRIITIKNALTNRLTAYDQFKLIEDYRASVQGTTAGRVHKWFLWVVR